MIAGTTSKHFFIIPEIISRVFHNSSKFPMVVIIPVAVCKPLCDSNDSITPLKTTLENLRRHSRDQNRTTDKRTKRENTLKMQRMTSKPSENRLSVSRMAGEVCGSLRPYLNHKNNHRCRLLCLRSSPTQQTSPAMLRESIPSLFI